MNRMGFWKSGRRERVRQAAGLYAAIVDQARDPVFYAHYAVPDTVDGRFDMICLHAALVMDRLGTEGQVGRRLSQALFDVMFRDMDRSLRERGVGDLSVPKHVKKMMKGFHGRAHVYAGALQKGAESGHALAEAVRRNIYAGAAVPEPFIEKLSRYVRDCADALAAVSLESLLEARARLFPPILSFDGKEGRDEGNADSRMVA